MYLLVTIDAEAVHGRSPLDEMMWGRLKGVEREYGIGLIADLCEKYNITATYFLDVYEHSYYGKDALKEVALYLGRRGHDVQLHTHPAWFQDQRDFKHIRRMKREQSCFPAEKYWMSLNSLEEQIEILRHGKDLLEEWLKKPVIAHRAGAYALDHNTLVALREVGIPIDSSMFYGHPHCKVIWSKNQPVEQEGILELPVTVLLQQTTWDWGVYRYERGMHYLKTDINWCSLEELQQFVAASKQKNGLIMNLFLHSYSLIKYDKYFLRFMPDESAIERLNAFLAFCDRDPEIIPVSLRDFGQRFASELAALSGEDSIPLISRTVKGYRFVPYKKRIKQYVQASVDNIRYGVGKIQGLF